RVAEACGRLSGRGWKNMFTFGHSRSGYTFLGFEPEQVAPLTPSTPSQPSPFPSRQRRMSFNFGDSSDDLDAPPEHLVSTPVVIIGLVSSIIFCIICTQIAFPRLLSLSLTILAILLALVMSIMGVRALGETDINPVSGI